MALMHLSIACEGIEVVLEPFLVVSRRLEFFDKPSQDKRLGHQQPFNNGFTLALLLVEQEQRLLKVCLRSYLNPLPPVTLPPIICKLALVLQPKRRWRFAEVIVTTMRSKYCKLRMDGVYDEKY